MFLKAWKMSDDTVIIHDPACKHRKPVKSGRGMIYTEIVADGKQDYLSKAAFAADYWKSQELTVLDPFQTLTFMPCCDELQVQEPAKQKTPKAIKPPRVTGHKQWADKQPPRAMTQFAQWIEREFKNELGKITERDVRLIMIASKAYGAFQKSDLNKPDAA